MRKNIYIILTIFIIGFSSCEKFLEPISEGGRLTDKELMANPGFVEGLLIRAYAGLPNSYNTFNLDVASDDAVTNLQGSEITSIATGAWLSSFNPISVWENAYEQIRHINLFLDKYETVVWSANPVLSQSENEEKNLHMIRRLRGEAHGMRAFYQWQLLQFHSGRASDGTLLAFPIVTQHLENTDNWNFQRSTFAQCVGQIMSDLDIAIQNLPSVYADVPGQAMYNAASGARFVNRLNGNAAKALKSRVALLAASPAFTPASGITWDDAATIAGDLLKQLGDLIPAGKTFYTQASSKEMIWNQAVVQTRVPEQNSFPPSLFGNGRTNPTQSLVDAFPMRNGYPIDHPLSNFDETNPYALRDVRLGDYILFNGSSFKSQVINTYVGAALDGVGSLQTSTRTGYYLKKFMLPAASLNPGNLVNAPHSYTLIRETEALLNYAEAANEAWGPDGDPNGYGFTAKSK